MDLNIINNSLDETVDFLIELIKIDTQEANPLHECPFGKGPKIALDKTLNYCKDLGFRTKNIDNYIGYAEIGEGDELIGIPMHLDIVPPGEGWSVDPFGGEIIDGVIYGRGVIDNKGAVSMLIHVLKNISESYEKINKRVRLLFGTNEETGMNCIKHYIEVGEEIPKIGFTPDAMYPVVNGEKGRVHIKITRDISIDPKQPYLLLDGGIKENVVPSNCNARIIKENIIEFNEIGISSHGSSPEKGENAISKLLKKLYSQDAQFQFKDQIQLIEKYLGRDFHGNELGINKPDNIFKNTTLNLGILKVTDSQITCELDIRYGLNIELDEIVESINKVFHKPWNVDVLSHKNLHYVDSNDPTLKKLLESYEEVTGEKGYTIAMGGGTYASYFDNMIAFGPKFMEYKTGGHGVDERVPIEHIKKNMEIYTVAIIKLLDL